MHRTASDPALRPLALGLLILGCCAPALAQASGSPPPTTQEDAEAAADSESETGTEAGTGTETETETESEEPRPQAPELPPQEERAEQVDDDREKPIDVQLGAQAAADAEAAEAQAQVEAKQQSERDRKRRKDKPWIERWRPERNMIELGLFGGVFLADPEHDLYDPRTAPQEPLWEAAPDVGVRLGYFPLRVLGVEAEFSAVPNRVRSLTDDPVFVYGFRGHAIAQLPFHSVTPFFLASGGLLGVRSNIILLGNDIDPAVHYGGGVKVFFNRWLGARVEARNIISALEARQDSATSHVQVLAGLTFTFLRAKPKPIPVQPPPPDPDRDKDGFRNEVDECPDEPGVAPHGCPDTDGDGFRDSEDECPEVPGVAPAGCPAVDTDGDGILDPVDACPEVKENYNGYEDEDGCPDELPEKVKKFTGTIEGIFFEFNEAKIRPESKPKLDEAVEILKEYENIRVRITGHTDDVGTPEFNEELSEKRAAAVKQYLVDEGVDPDRIETEGKGATDPLVPNTTDENRAKNRRIEFQVIDQGTPKDDGNGNGTKADSAAEKPQEPPED